MTPDGLFFPSHDLALANGVRHFNPPAAARQLEADLSGIERWWQDGEADAAPVPWGWSWDMRERLAARGTSRLDMPTDAELEQLRQLSSRRTSRRLHQALRDVAASIDEPRVVDDEPSLRALVDEHRASGVPMVMKAPWSSSGRGQMRWPEHSDAAFVCRGVSLIRRQGCAVVERWYDKLQDFAMLFRVRRTAVEWVGYSLFDCDDNGTYRRGILAPDAVLEDMICSTTTGGDAAASDDAMRQRLHVVRQRYAATILPELFASFFGRTWEVGYVGIDMMVIRDAHGAAALHPCVELNVRCTMGVVAHRMAQQMDDARLPAVFCLRPSVDGHFTMSVEHTAATFDD